MNYRNRLLIFFNLILFLLVLLSQKQSVSGATTTNISHVKSVEDCQILDLIAMISNCENDSFIVTLDFEFIDVGNDGYTVMGNGHNYGIFSYDSVPLTLGPLPADNTPYEFVVKDVQMPDCSDFVEVGEVDCDTSECMIWELSVETGECTSDSTYEIIINFLHLGTSGLGFDLFANGDFFGFYSYDDLPLEILDFPSNGTNGDWIKVCDNDNPDCCAIKQFNGPDCSGECAIFDLTGNIVECENDVFYIKLDFEYDNTGSDGYSVQGNGFNYGIFPYDSIPLILGPLPADNTPYEFIVKDVQMPDCSDFIETGVVDCDSSDCMIWDLVTETGECTSDSTYELTINFNYSGTSNLGFDLYANGEFFGFYFYSDLPLTINDFPQSGGNGDWVKVCDNDNPNCCKIEDWPSPDCDGDECHIWDMHGDIIECENDSFFILINFEYNNTGDDGFKIVGNGTHYGIFQYDSLPVLLGPLSADNTDYEFLARDLQMPDCSDFIEVGEVDCGSDECEIGNIDIQVIAINNDSTFDIVIDFDHNNTTDSFQVYSDWNFLDNYAYDDLPVTIYNFPSRGLMYEHILICDIEYQDCCLEHEFLSPDCLNNNCQITELTAEVAGCENDSIFFHVDFDYINVSNEGFKIIGNGKEYGVFDYHDLPVIIGDKFIEGFAYDIVAMDLLNINCLNYTVVTDAACDECKIRELGVDIGDCTSDSTYIITINFVHSGTSGVGFDLWANGEFFGFYSYSDLPLTIENFPKSGGDWDWLKVCDNDNLNCCKAKEFESPLCMSNISEPEPSSLNLIYYSASSILYLESNSKADLSIYDASGRTIEKIQNAGNNTVILNHLVSGFYYLHFTDGKYQIKKKIIVY